MPTKNDANRSARDRLLDTADRLFYSSGVQTVGVDRVLEESGVAKRSLYRNFGSKNGLIEAYLQRRHQGTIERLSEAIASVDDPREKVLAVFDAQARTFSEPGFNGCAITNADSEAEPGSVIDHAAAEFRAWIRSMFIELAAGIKAEDPQRLGRQLHALYDGGITAAKIDHDATIAADTRAAAQTLVETCRVRP